jgi:MFS family permease
LYHYEIGVSTKVCNAVTYILIVMLTALGIMMTVFGTGSMVGGPLAGYISDKHGWKISFWLQVGPDVLKCNKSIDVGDRSP